MCGIAGIVKLNSRDAVEEPRLARMVAALRHRGPDGQGLLLDGPVGLGHTRLAIVDVSGGRQPIENEQSTACIVCNGEIYNHPELSVRLAAAGHRYRTRSDSETILHAYEDDGVECLRRLDGMFAFAVWDRALRRLFLARDRLGIKPLYYRFNERELLFASEIKALFAAGPARPELDLEALPEYLAHGFVAGRRTLFRGIRQLLPGWWLSWSPDAGLQARQYWRLPEPVERDGQSTAGYVRGVRERLTAAVQSHLMSDVPLGLFLSGGLDSSGLAALMHSMTREPIRTFAVGFPEAEANELDYARLVARRIGAEHHQIVVRPEQFFAELPRMVWHEDEPIAFPASIPLYFVSELAARQVKVVLTGEGADELFLGYNRYRVTAWNQRLGRLCGGLLAERTQRRLRGLLGRMPGRLARAATRSFLALPRTPRAMFCENFAVFPAELRRQLEEHPELEALHDAHAESLQRYAEGRGGALDRMSRADVQTYLVRLLMKQDRMSMAASIESRVPYLDRRLAEYVLEIPGRFKLRGWTTKVLLREALRDLVPEPILVRRKMGFPVPLGRWLRGPFTHLLDDLVLGPRTGARDLWNRPCLERLVGEHRRGAANHADRLWLLINLELWLRVFVDGEDVGELSRTVAA